MQVRDTGGGGNSRGFKSRSRNGAGKNCDYVCDPSQTKIPLVLYGFAAIKRRPVSPFAGSGAACAPVSQRRYSSRATISSAARIASATLVSVGLQAVEVGSRRCRRRTDCENPRPASGGRPRCCRRSLLPCDRFPVMQRGARRQDHGLPPGATRPSAAPTRSVTATACCKRRRSPSVN